MIGEIEIIKQLSLAFGPSGCEEQVRELIRENIKHIPHREAVDRLGNLICKMSFGDSNSSVRARIMLAAHMDEVGMMIDGITDGGMLTFGCVGGIDNSVMSGRRVLVRGEDEGLYSGVICSKAVHHKDKEERKHAPKAEKLFIDLGFCDKAEAEKKIAVGNFAAFDSEFYCFGKGNDTVKCKALDDRMGCAAMIQVMERLTAEPIDEDIDIYFCFTVREEIGYSGAAAAAAAIAPQLALVLETTAISDLCGTVPHRRVADVCGGVVLSLADRATIYSRERVDAVAALAKENGISAQIKRYVSGGNDAGKIHKALGGIPVLALSVPTRYLHSPACVASLSDYRAQRDLIYGILRHNKNII